ncbi:MAG: hypothetical protein AAGI53_11740 [Planctomycetota bacterium]
MTRALTLIETLAAILLLGMAFALLAPGLAPVSEDAKLDAFIARFVDLDRRARLLARRGDIIEIRNTSLPSPAVSLRLNDEAVAMIELPPEYRVELVADSDALDVVLFDRQGRSIDYQIRCRNGVSARRYAVSGLTGFAVDVSSRVESP